jgi:hypothetical protein
VKRGGSLSILTIFTSAIPELLDLKTNYKKEKNTNLPIQKQGTCIIKKISTWALYILNMKTTIILWDIY